MESEYRTATGAREGKNANIIKRDGWEHEKERVTPWISFTANSAPASADSLSREPRTTKTQTPFPVPISANSLPRGPRTHKRVLPSPWTAYP